MADETKKKAREETLPDMARLQLEGLLLIAEHHRAKLKEVEVVAADLLKVEDEGGGYFGHVSDAVYTPGSTVKDLLRKLDAADERKAVPERSRR